MKRKELNSPERIAFENFCLSYCKQIMEKAQRENILDQVQPRTVQCMLAAELKRHGDSPNLKAAEIKAAKFLALYFDEVFSVKWKSN